MHTPCERRAICEERPPDLASRDARSPCPACRGSRLDPACAGHRVDARAVVYCGCEACGGADVAVTLGHSDLAALAAD